MDKSTKPEPEFTREKIELLQQANDLIWSHIATMAHEVRTPATLLVGLSEYMMRQEADTLTEKQLQHLDSIHKNSQRLLETFEYFVDLSRVTLFSQGHIMEEVDLEELCKEAGLPSIERNESQTIPHIWSDKYFLKSILEIIASFPFPTIERQVNLSTSQNEIQLILNISITYNRDLIFWKADPRLQSCQIGIRNLGGQLSCEDSEDRRISLWLALPTSPPDKQ